MPLRAKTNTKNTPKNASYQNTEKDLPSKAFTKSLLSTELLNKLILKLKSENKNENSRQPVKLKPEHHEFYSSPEYKKLSRYKNLYRFSVFNLFLFMIVQVLLSPFTKVEESFNMQASHDILIHGSHIEEYDHHEFPGPVPRTFIGGLVLASLNYPFYLLNSLILGKTNKFLLQILIRITLGSINCYSLKKLADCFFIEKEFYLNVEKYNSTKKSSSHQKNSKNYLDTTASITYISPVSYLLASIFLIVSISQFHVIFYVSRLLPNSFAFSLVIFSFVSLIQNKIETFCLFGGISMVVFRSELILFYGPALVLLLAMVYGV